MDARPQVRGWTAAALCLCIVLWPLSRMLATPAVRRLHAPVPANLHPPLPRPACLRTTPLPHRRSHPTLPPFVCSPKGEKIPHGMIFACFMVSSMVGSAIAGKLLANGSK